MLSPCANRYVTIHSRVNMRMLLVFEGIDKHLYTQRAYSVHMVRAPGIFGRFQCYCWACTSYAISGIQPYLNIQKNLHALITLHLSSVFPTDSDTKYFPLSRLAIVCRPFA